MSHPLSFILLLLATGDVIGLSYPCPRRRVFLTGYSSTLLVQAVSLAAASPAQGSLPTQMRTIEKQGDRLGLQLEERSFGSRSFIIVVKDSAAVHDDTVRPAGMVLEGYPTIAKLRERLDNGPYPVQLTFRPSVEEESRDEYRIIRTQSAACTVRSLRGDVIEINYEAHLNNPSGRMYDSSAERGTGLPYQMVLGSGDMIPGVDQGLYGMCPGDVRELYIPSPLAYGKRGNKLFSIPSDSNLYWRIEFVKMTRSYVDPSE